MLRNSPFILKSIICEPLCNTSPPNIVGSCVVDRLILSAPERDLSAVFKFSCCSAFNGTTEVTVYSASLDSLLLKSKYLSIIEDKILILLLSTSKSKKFNVVLLTCFSKIFLMKSYFVFVSTFGDAK